MGGDLVRALARVVALALIAVAFWFLGKYDYAQPDVLAANAPATAFSAERAYATLAVCSVLKCRIRFRATRTPHVRARIQKEFAALGVKTSTYKAFTCNAWRGFASIPCATVTDIIGGGRAGRGQGDRPARALRLRSGRSGRIRRRVRRGHRSGNRARSAFARGQEPASRSRRDHGWRGSRVCSVRRHFCRTRPSRHASAWW